MEMGESHGRSYKFTRAYGFFYEPSHEARKTYVGGLKKVVPLLITMGHEALVIPLLESPIGPSEC
jgi:hypothetical protein